MATEADFSRRRGSGTLRRPMDREGSSKSGSRSVGRQAAIGLAVFCVVVAAILVAVWAIGDQANLPFDYQGYD